jgi:hypothetical protein
VILKNTKNLRFFFPILFLSLALNAQQVYVESGFGTAFFKDYVNNLGENTLDLSYSKSPELFLESGFRFDLYRERIMWDVGLSYNKYQINTGFFAGNVTIPTTYNLTYLTLKVGVLINVVNEPRFKIQIHSHLSYDGLISGTNKYRNEIINVYKENNFDKKLLRFHRGLSTEYTISEETAIYIKYNIADSFKEKGKDSSAGETYSLHTNSFSMGLLFDISGLINRLHNRYF